MKSLISMSDLSKRIKRVIEARILKRWGNTSTKKTIWNGEFASGQWDYIDHTYDDVIYLFLNKYANNGSILDLGCGSGILSLFAAQAGAKKVYAVEASNMAIQARVLIKANKFDGIITVVNKKIEDITEAEIPEKVDTIISEPLGTFLLNERMLESYIIAREKFLKPEGLMMPTSAHFCIMPF